MNTDTEDKRVKVSICQSCNGWVRAAALPYFQSSTKARNEFMKEVAAYNLAVNEFSLQEWKSAAIPICKCVLTNQNAHPSDSMNPTKIILPITPQTAIRMVQGDKKLFRIPEVCYKGRGSKGCKDWKRTGYCSHTLNHGGRLRKRRIERYNDYKEALRTIAKSRGFYLLDYGCAIYFHVPVPKRWSEPDKIAMHGQMNHRRPDADNFWRAFSDALRADDERISQLSGLGKFWVNQPEGYIEIVYGEVYNPHGVKFIDQSTIKSLSYNNEYNKRRKEARYEPSHKRSKNKIKKPSDKELMSREDNIK